MKIRAGDWVVVRPWEQIAASLDQNAELENLPFMAEMQRFCGQRLRVSAVAHKTCDTINKSGGRKVENALHLEGVRCDGSAHGGCQAACLIFWKTDWLQCADGNPVSDRTRQPSDSDAQTMDAVRAAGERIEDGQAVYRCQATRLYAASSPLKWWDVRQYSRDVWYRNVGFGRLLRVTLLRCAYNLRNLPTGYRVAVKLHDWLHRLVTGRPTPYRHGTIPAGEPTPDQRSGIAPGEWVQVKPLDEILKTLSETDRNRGLRFDPEMAQFCGQQFMIERHVERIIDEQTGAMLTMRSPCLVLDGAVCKSDYSAKRIFCPRQIPSYFREIWLQRVVPDARPVTSDKQLGRGAVRSAELRTAARTATSVHDVPPIRSQS